MPKLKSLIVNHKLVTGLIAGVLVIVAVSGTVLYTNHQNELKEQARIESAKDNAEHVDSMIKGFKEVTLDKEKELEKVNKAYNNLTKEEKGFVTEKKTLDKLNKTLSSLKEQSKKDKETAMSCMDKINAIGEVTLDSESKIADARNTYNALTDVQKALVTNTDVLTNAENTLSAKKEEQAKATAKANEEAKKKAQANTKKAQTNNQTNNQTTNQINNANANTNTSTPSTNNATNEDDISRHSFGDGTWRFSDDYPGYNSPDELPDGYNCAGMIWSKERHTWYKP